MSANLFQVFGSAGVIGNPMGFARNVGLGIKDFLSVNGVVKVYNILITFVPFLKRSVHVFLISKFF